MRRAADDLRARIGRSATLGEKLRALAKQRTDEGYMAEVRRDGVGFLFIENHCPICAAATVCQGFCSTELDLFRTRAGSGVTVERGGAHRVGRSALRYRVSAAGDVK